MKLTQTPTLSLAPWPSAQRTSPSLAPAAGWAAAKTTVIKMIERGWLRELDVNPSRNGPLWREIGDGQGPTLVVTDAALPAIPVAPMLVKP